MPSIDVLDAQFEASRIDEGLCNSFNEDEMAMATERDRAVLQALTTYSPLHGVMVRRFVEGSNEEERAAAAAAAAFFRRGAGPLQPGDPDGAWLPTVEDID